MGICPTFRMGGLEITKMVMVMMMMMMMMMLMMMMQMGL